MAFFQEPPRLGNQYADDRVLRSFLARALPDDVREAVVPELEAMGELAGGELYQLQLADRLNEPRLTSFDPWGQRVDTIELTAVWKRAARIAAERGLVATAYERAFGRYARIHQFALVYLFDPSADTYTCPLAMTDGAAATLAAHDNTLLRERALPRLLSRDPDQVWTSGQWMTERTGGSDVGRSRTIAQPCEGAFYGVDKAFRLFGSKWFTSAATSEMALTLARPVGQPAGSRGLTLFYVETRGSDGASNNIVLNRLKDKLGTRKLPTAELTLDGTVALPVTELGNGVRHITPMLNVTRTWNAISSVAMMRRGLALARDYARRRVQFGAPLSEQALHLDTLAGLQAEMEGAFHLTFRVVDLIGRHEAGEAVEVETHLLRALTPIAKLLTAKQCVAVLSEVLECFGGAGYVEDTGLPRLLRDAQVLPIWEGTTNVLSLDLLRALGRDRSTKVLEAELKRLMKRVKHDELRAACDDAKAAIKHAGRWLTQPAGPQTPAQLEAGARRLAFTVGRALEVALLARHAQWAWDHEQDPRPIYATRRLRRAGIDRIDDDLPLAEAAALGMDSLT